MNGIKISWVITKRRAPIVIKAPHIHLIDQVHKCKSYSIRLSWYSKRKRPEAGKDSIPYIQRNILTCIQIIPKKLLIFFSQYLLHYSLPDVAASKNNPVEIPTIKTMG